MRGRLRKMLGRRLGASRRPLNFPHVPKCGGTTVLRSLEQQAHVFRDYDHPPSATDKFFQAQCKRRNADFCDMDFSKFAVIYGHYPLDRYDPSYPKVALLRNPVARAVSHFNYWKYQLPETNQLALARSPIIMDVKAGRVDVVDLAKAERFDLFYDIYLGRMPPSAFDLLGTQENMEAFATSFHKLFGIRIDTGVRHRESTKTEAIGEATIEALKRYLADDLAWYEECRRAWSC